MASVCTFISTDSFAFVALEMLVRESLYNEKMDISKFGRI